jgi:hypothetical protein
MSNQKKVLSETNTLAYYVPSSTANHKTLHNIDIKGQCYETFYGHKLRIYEWARSVIICPCKPFLPSLLLRKFETYSCKKFYNNDPRPTLTSSDGS